MPELPEVETIVRYLRPRVVGKEILEMHSDTPRLFRGHKNSGEVRYAVVGKKIIGLARAGKNIVFRLSDGKRFLIHLMMTGKLLWNPQGNRKHDRMILRLSGGNKLVLNDVRKFGRCRIVESPTKLVGSDPLQIEFKKFEILISGRGGAIKNLLLNQKILAGIGNIYSDEILWYAGINPLRTAASLKEPELKKIYSAARRVLYRAIGAGGTSARDYLKPDGSKGGYYKIRKVYQRAGEKCSRDNAIIKRIKVGQRSAHFCPKHQK